MSDVITDAPRCECGELLIWAPTEGVEEDPDIETDEMLICPKCGLDEPESEDVTP